MRVPFFVDSAQTSGRHRQLKVVGHRRNLWHHGRGALLVDGVFGLSRKRGFFHESRGAFEEFASMTIR
jgi:hypothetical protein